MAAPCAASSIGLPRPTTARVVPPRRLSIGPNPTEASKPQPSWRGTEISNPFPCGCESANFWFLSGGTVFLRYTYDKAKRHHQKACAMKLEGIVSKRVDAASAPGNRGLRLKVKCLHREEFVSSARPIQKARAPFLARCYSPTTIGVGA